MKNSNKSEYEQESKVVDADTRFISYKQSSVIKLCPLDAIVIPLLHRYNIWGLQQQEEEEEEEEVAET